MSDVKKIKRPDSNRTEKAKAIAIARRQTRLAIVKNGGRF